MIFDVALTLILAVAGALMLCAFLLSVAGGSDFSWALLPLVAAVVAYGAITALWSGLEPT